MRGIPKDYKFIPKKLNVAPSIKFYSLSRARIEINEVLFRAIEHGVVGNLISVELRETVFIVKSRKLTYPYAKVLKYDGDSVIERTISGVLLNGELVSTNNVISTTANKIVFSDVGKIEPIVETYLVSYTEPTGGESGSSGGVDFELLRNAVNGVSKLITIPLSMAGDVRKTAPDPTKIRPFGPVFLAGGSGLPPTPDDAATGPLRALAGVSFVEDGLGVYTPKLSLYEWVGSSSDDGEWKLY